VVDWREFRARQRVVELEGIAHRPLRVAYADEGEGRPVLLLHGIPTWSFLWREVIPSLARNRRVIAPDFLGHGFSDRRDRFDRALPAQTAMVMALLRELDLERVDLVGHDTGGGVALIMAIEHPERVRRLVLSNIVCYDSWPVAEMIELGDPRLRARPAAEIVAKLREGFGLGVHRRRRLTAEFVDGIVAPYADEAGKLSLIRNAVSLNTNHTMALVDRHGEISAETLLLWGAEDPWQTIGDARRLEREIPKAELQPVEAASHWLQQDEPAGVAEAIDTFLGREPGRPTTKSATQ
jgi:haloalkane dehalogenase